jgi:hypothetical protein
MLKHMTSALVFVLCAGCASNLKVYDGSKVEAKGIPIATPVLVKITTVAKYEVDPKNKGYASYCVDDQSEAYKTLPLGDLYYVTFESAKFGKSEFAVNFNDSGLLKSVTLNSDPKIAENIDAAGKFVSAVASAAKTVAALDVPVVSTAQEIKDKYCIKKSESARIERAVLP